MKVLHLNTFDSGGGAARAAFRLNRGLQGIGVESRMLVQFKFSDATDVIGPQTSFEKVIHNVRPHMDALPVRLYPNRPVLNFSPALLPDNLTAKVTDFTMDIIHLHWVGGGFLRLETLKRFNKPLVWTLHDSWAFTGGCHIPFECTRYRQVCGACPILGSKREWDLSRWVFQRKKKAWQGLNLAVVAPSRWLADCAGSSSLFYNVRVEVIPNGLDLNRFKPVDKNLARELFSLPHDKKLILFGAVDATGNKNKGFNLLLSTLRALSKNIQTNRCELIVFGSPEPADMPDFGLKSQYLGRLYDEISLVLLYSAADVIVVPSIQEAFGQTASEAMACGTPVVSFETTGLVDIVDHKRTGYLARPFEPDDLAKGIAWVLEDDRRRHVLSQQARQKVEKEFDLTSVAKRYVDLYNDILRDS